MAGLDSYTKALLHFNTDTIDSASNIEWIKSGNSTINTTQKKFGAGSLFLDGTNSYIYIPINDDFNFGTNDFTIDWWEYRLNSGAGQPIVCIQTSPTDGNFTHFSLVLGWVQNGSPAMFSSTTGGGYEIAHIISMGSMITNAWVHQALVRKGSTFYLFQNGNLITSFQNSGSIYYSSNYQVTIGARNNSYFNGYIDEFRVSNTARWTEAFTPPTVEYTFEGISTSPQMFIAYHPSETITNDINCTATPYIVDMNIDIDGDIITDSTNINTDINCSVNYDKSFIYTSTDITGAVSINSESLLIDIDNCTVTYNNTNKETITPVQIGSFTNLHDKETITPVQIGSFTNLHDKETITPVQIGSFTNLHDKETITPILIMTYIPSILIDIDCSVTLISSPIIKYINGSVFANDSAMITDPVIGDTYIDKDDIINAEDDIIKLTNHNRLHTEYYSELMNPGLIPKLLDIKWERVSGYFRNGKYVINRENNSISLAIEGLQNLYDLNKNKDYCFNEYVQSAYSKKLIRPFLLFIDGCQINWSRILIVRSDDYTTLVISNISRYSDIKSVNIIYMPFEVEYSEYGDEIDIGNVLFRFNKDGKLGGFDTVLSTPKTNVVPGYYEMDSFNKFQLTIPYDYILTGKNLFLFDENGLFVTDYTYNIESSNILTINDGNFKGKLLCIYDTESYKSKDHTARGLNEPFIKNTVAKAIEFNDMNKELFEEKFNFKYSKDKKYADNVSDGIKYIFGYNQNIYDLVSKKHSSMGLVQYGMNDIINQSIKSKSRSITMLRNVYNDLRTEEFPIIFHNGYLPDYYKDIVYTGKDFTFTPSSLSTGDTFEILYMHNVRNELIKLDFKYYNDYDYLNMKNFYFSKDEILVYTDNRGEYNLCPLNYTIDDNGRITLQNPKFLYTQLYIGSKNQFIYERYKFDIATNVVPLSPNFKTGYNPEKYMIFINGRLVNRRYYRISSQKLETETYTKRILYTAQTIKPKDRLDVIYCNIPKLNRVNLSGDLRIYCIRTKAIEEQQIIFKVPYPFKNYLKTKDAFFCIKDNKYVDKDLYEFTDDTHDYIKFTKTYVDYNKDLIFVFPFYGQPYDDTFNLTSTDIEFIDKSVRIAEDTNIVTIPDMDSLGTLQDSKTVLVFIDSTYVDPELYSISNNTITFNYTVPATKYVTVSIEINTDKINTNELELETYQVPVEKGTYIVDIPKEYDYSETLMVFKGTVLLSRESYVVTTDNKLFLNYQDTDYMADENRNILFVYSKYKNSDYVVKLQPMVFPINNELSTLDITYNKIKFKKENIIVFLDSTFIPEDRYEVSDNVLKLNYGLSFTSYKKVTIMFGYKSKIRNLEEGHSEKETILFQDAKASPYYHSSGIYRYKIPWVLYPLRDTAFFISNGDLFVPTDKYTVSGDILTYYSTSTTPPELRFTFVHNKGFTDIRKFQTTMQLTSNIAYIPSPYYGNVDLNNRMLVIYGEEYVDKSRYRIDTLNKRIIFNDIPIAGNNKQLTLIMFYTGTYGNSTVAYLPESGYVTFYRNDITANNNKDLYMLFVNGRKVPKSQIIDVSNSLAKVKIDIQRRYNLEVLDYSPLLTTFNGKYNPLSKWEKILDPLPV